MTRDNYIRITSFIRKGDRRVRVVQIINWILTILVFCTYPAWLLHLLWHRDMRLVPAVLVPFVSFVVLSLFRHIINRPRPYEKFEIPSAIPKETRGKSFPSRHVFSAMIIAMTLLFQAPDIWIGVVLSIIAVALGVIRVLGGVHYISDVLVGLLAGIACGILGFWLF